MYIYICYSQLGTAHVTFLCVCVCVVTGLSS